MDTDGGGGSARTWIGRRIDVAHWAPRVALTAVMFFLVFGVWSVGSGIANDNGWLCGMTNSNGTTVGLPDKQRPIAEYKDFVREQNGCAAFDVELTVTGEHAAGTVIGPVGQLVTFKDRDPIELRVEADPRDFWLACGDFTGARAGNASHLTGDRDRCDISVQTRCLDTGVLGLCPERGNTEQRCLNRQGHVTLVCAGAAVCLDRDGRFGACEQ